MEKLIYYFWKEKIMRQRKNKEVRQVKEKDLGEQGLPPKSEWWSPFVPFEPIADEFQPLNGDVMCDGELLKGAYPKGTGTDALARKYLQHMNYHKETCNPVMKSRKAIEK